MFIEEIVANAGVVGPIHENPGHLAELSRLLHQRDHQGPEP
jgi:hypothetical protein